MLYLLDILPELEQINNSSKWLTRTYLQNLPVVASVSWGVCRGPKDREYVNSYLLFIDCVNGY